MSAGCSQRKLRALYGKWVEALYSYDVDIWDSHTATKTSSCRGSESPCRLAASLVAKAKVIHLGGLDKQYAVRAYKGKN